MRYIVLCIVIGYVLGLLTFYIFTRKSVGTLRIIDHEEMTSVFLELDRELEEVRSKGKVTLRVENSSYNDNQY